LGVKLSGKLRVWGHKRDRGEIEVQKKTVKRGGDGSELGKKKVNITISHNLAAFAPCPRGKIQRAKTVEKRTKSFEYHGKKKTGAELEGETVLLKEFICWDETKGNWSKGQLKAIPDVGEKPRAAD